MPCATFFRSQSFATAAAAAISVFALTACGGGGGDGLPCGGSSTLSLDVTYQVNGVVVDPSRTVLLERGQPVVASPQVLGLPAACASEVRWSYKPSLVTPPGLSFDATTGRITGTPTALSTFSVQLQLEVNGYPGIVMRNVSFFM